VRDALAGGLRRGAARSWCTTRPTPTRRGRRNSWTVAAADWTWPRSAAEPNGPASAADLAGLQKPKLFRRLVPYLAAVKTSLDCSDAWLRTDPVNRDNALFLLDRGNMHDVIHAPGAGPTHQLTCGPSGQHCLPQPGRPGSTMLAETTVNRRPATLHWPAT